MNIEIRKVGFINKGAELMFLSIYQKIKQKYPNTKFALQIHPKRSSYKKLTSLNLMKTIRFYRFGFEFGLLSNLIPKFIKKKFSIIDDNDIDLVLDAAGFEYSDDWSIKNTKELASFCKRFRKNKTKIILLPQALGPFRGKEIKSYIREIVHFSDLILPREKESYNNLIEVVGKNKKIMVYPDFTNITEGIIPEYFDKEKLNFCIIPNFRMIDKTENNLSEKYLNFLNLSIKYVQKKGLKPFFLINEFESDLELAKEINKNLDEKLEILIEPNPLKIKGIIGSVKGLISSRYHGLVCALSQSIPSIGAGWSHKYKMLFEDYGFPEGIIDINNKDEILKKIDLITNYDTKESLKIKIEKESIKIKTQTNQMWELIFKKFFN